MGQNREFGTVRHGDSVRLSVTLLLSFSFAVWWDVDSIKPEGQHSKPAFASERCCSVAFSLVMIRQRVCFSHFV